MKHFSKLLALTLALMLVVFCFAACGQKGGETAAQGNTEAAPAAPAGETQTWGRITLFVPEGYTLNGGNGMVDPDDPKTLWLYSNSNNSTYYNVKIMDAEDAALSIDTTREMNAESDPVDVNVTAGGVNWTGVGYKYAGTLDCFSVYGTVNGQTVFVMAAGNAADGAVTVSILESLSVTE